MSRHLHIVCLDAPYPPDYGGAIEMFGRIKALHREGVRIHLHYFDYHGNDVYELNNYCETIQSYQRKLGWKGFSFSLPYIVSSRINNDLTSDLNKDNYPVILEGIHCTGILDDIDAKRRKILIRLHNDEAAYYQKLAAYENNFFKRLI